MRIILLIILFALLQTAAAEITETMIQAKALQLENLDPLENKKWRKPVKNAYRSPFGIQIHNMCFHYIEHYIKNSKKLKLKWDTRGNIETRFDEWLYKAASAVTDNCKNKYPELDPYTNSWISHFRRTVIACSKKGEESAINVVVGVVPPFILTKKEREGITTGFLPNRNHKALIVLPFIALTKIFHPLRLWEEKLIEKVIVHEIFHATHANNRSDHDFLQRRKFKKWKSVQEHHNYITCGNNQLIDRILTLSAICTNSPVAKTPLPQATINGNKVTRQLFHRISQCGVQRGCLDVFTSKGDNQIFNIALPSKGLGHDRAKHLCKRLYRKGFCQQNLLNEQTTQRIPAVKMLRKKIQKRLSEIVHNHEDDLLEVLHFTGHEESTGNYVSWPFIHIFKNMATGNYPSNGYHAKKIRFEEQVPLHQYLEDIDWKHPAIPLLGKQLVKDYVRVMRKYHYASPDFACEELIPDFVGKKLFKK